MLNEHTPLKPPKRRGKGEHQPARIKSSIEESQFLFSPLVGKRCARLQPLQSRHLVLARRRRLRQHIERCPCGWLSLVIHAISEEQLGALMRKSRLRCTGEETRENNCSGGIPKDALLPESARYCPFPGSRSLARNESRHSRSCFGRSADAREKRTAHAACSLTGQDDGKSDDSNG